jgi:hypothetical protein
VTIGETAGGAEAGAPITLLARILRGDTTNVDAMSDAGHDALCAHALEQGVLPLVCARLASVASAPLPLLAKLRRAAAADAAGDLAREQELRLLLAGLADAGVEPLVIKGAQLAYTLYPRPDLRPRVDTDLLIPLDQRDRAHRVLLGLDYEPARQMRGDLVAYQAFYVKRRGALPVHAVDMHWKIANSQVFADVLGYEELAAEAVRIPRLSPAARGLSPVHALLLACTHRVAHHFDAECLIWLYDIDLLARRMTDEEWRRFADLAADRKVFAVCRRSLEQASRWFGTAVPDWVWRDARLPIAREGELSAGYLRPRRHVGVIVDDVRALATWSARWHLLYEHFFPPAHYMRTVYAPGSRWPLPVLHARRLARGARRWLIRR